MHDAGPLRSERRRGKLLPGDDVDLLCGSAEFFPALIEAIDAAQRRIALETYAHTDNATAHSATEALTRTVRRSVDIHLTIDDFDTGLLSPSAAAMLKTAGMNLRIYRPVRGFRLQRRHLRRLHRKIAVIDDDEAFVGGINIIDDLNCAPFNDTALRPCYDFAVRMCSPLVTQIALTADRLWWQMGVRVSIREVGVAGIAAEFPVMTDTPRPRHRGASGQESRRAPGTVLAPLVLRDNVRNRRAIERKYLRALGVTRHEVVIANAYFLPGMRLMRALATCRRRDVRMRPLLQGQVGYRLQHYATRSLYHMLLRDNVEAHEYTVSFLYAKMAVVDDRWATVGSNNIDPFSLLLAREVNVVVWDSTVANGPRSALEDAMAHHTRHVLADTHAARRWWWRLADWYTCRLVRLGIVINGHAAQYQWYGHLQNEQDGEGMRVITADEAARLVQPGWVVACAGFVGMDHVGAVMHALERRFLTTSEPRDLTLVYSAGRGDCTTHGINHFSNLEMARCVVSGRWRSATQLADMALAEQCDTFNLPQDVLMHLCYAIAGGKPGVLTKMGLYTFIDPRTELDPRYHGRAINHRTKATQAAGRTSWIKYERFRGNGYLFYPSSPLHCIFLRGTAADPRGNISTHEGVFHHELLAMARAVCNSGGIIVTQVRRLVDRHDNLQAVHVLGILVDYMVTAEDGAEHQMTFGEAFNPTYIHPWQDETTQLRKDAIRTSDALGASRHGALDARTLVQRRAVLEPMAQQPRVVNLGVGMSAAAGTPAEQGRARGFTLAVETGSIGSTPADSLNFGISAYPGAVVDQPAQFDFHEGGGIDLAILGLAELDGAGNVSVGLFGEGGDTIIAGVGDFINITQSARSIVFMGTLTAGGLQVEAGDGKLRIICEERLKKIVPTVSHLTFNGEYTARSGILVRYVTKRAIFEMCVDDNGGRCLTLTEIAPGIDLQRDILDRCAVEAAVVANLREMDARIFHCGAMCTGITPV